MRKVGITRNQATVIKESGNSWKERRHREKKKSAVMTKAHH